MPLKKGSSIIKYMSFPLLSTLVVLQSGRNALTDFGNLILRPCLTEVQIGISDFVMIMCTHYLRNKLFY